MGFDEYAWPSEEKPPKLEKADKQAGAKKKKKAFSVWNWLKAGTKVDTSLEFTVG